MENTSLKLLYGSAFRAPSFTELYHMNNPVLIGNPDLDPEKVKTYEAGLEHRFSERYTLRLNYFYNDVEDLIILGEKPSPTEPALYENKGSAKVQGIETELLIDFGNDYYGYLNHSYQDPQDGETDKRLADVPSQRANAGINLAPWKYLNANVNVSWTGKRPRAEGDTRDNLSSSTLVDVTLIAKKFYETLEIRGSVYNLFNEDYRDPSPFPVQVPNDYPTNEKMFLIEARYSF
jgi:iron complex outermembrane receptor protein